MQDIIGQTILDRYRVDAFVGRGGMAEVYKVWDRQRLTHLAMKVLRDDLALDVVFLDRFQREARTLEKLQHPNIVRFYGLEQDQRLAFMLMEFVEGETLKHEIFDHQGRGMPAERVMAMMRPVCSALGFAHNQGLVHCDMKPGNVMVHQNGTVLVTDFGIARMTDAATATMVGMGTPAYMAPEQVRGHDPTPQTDIYALGVVLYEMLTGGRRPFTGEQAATTGSTSEKVRWEQLNLQAPSPRTYNPEISPSVEAVVLRCLSKDPVYRFGTTIDLLNALEQAMGEAAITVPPRAVEARAAPLTEASAVDDAPPEPEPAAVIEPASASRMEKRQVPPAKPAAPSARKPRQKATPDKPAPKPASPQATAAAQPIRHRKVPAWLWVVAAVVMIGVAIGGVALSRTTCQRSGLPVAACAGVTLNKDWTPYTKEIGGVEMALVPAGCFQMGSDSGSSDERPVHKVCFEKPYWIDVYEVTNSQFAELGGQAGHSSTWTDAERPRESIAWTEAGDFCQKRGARLPTEAEWEYAARGSDGLVYPWGNTWDDTLAVWSTSQTASVGSKPGGVSWVGALDLSGNVWEWVSDWYSDGYYGTLTDGVTSPQGPDGGAYRVLRGGSWNHHNSNNLRATYRYWLYPDGRNRNIGFRCALSN